MVRPKKRYGFSIFLHQDDMDGALQLLQTFLGTVPYCNVTNYEGHYHQMLFIIFALLTAYVVDVHTPSTKGNIEDWVIE